MKGLIQNYGNIMTPFPNEDIAFNLVETIDLRNFKIVSKSSLNNADGLKKFKNKFKDRYFSPRIIY